MTGKRALRSRIRAERRALPREVLARTGEGMCAVLAGTEEWRRAETVFLFLSTRGEPDTSAILARARAEGKRVCVPRICGREMTPVELRADTPMTEGYCGIPEPAEGRCVPPEEIHLALLPCVAADADGARLGQGGGFYDRFLSEYSGDAAALVPERFLLPAGEIPVEPWDRRVPAVLTEERILATRR